MVQAQHTGLLSGTPGLSIQAARRLRIITATSLFDGHDAAINIMRRIMQDQGAEVIHLGHNRSVEEIVSAAIQEDVDAIAVSAYQGGHLEFFQYLIDELKRYQTAIKVFGGGGGVILAEEVRQLHDYGVTRIYTPEDSQLLGLTGMIKDLLKQCKITAQPQKPTLQVIHDKGNHWQALAKSITQIENGQLQKTQLQALRKRADNKKNQAVVLGITGPGGCGKSSLTDELILRFIQHYQATINIALLAVDPTRKKTQGALLGDRIRMNAINHKQVFMRSMATRSACDEIPLALADVITALKAQEFHLILIETPGIGQENTGITNLVDFCLYVMTSEFGAATQLEKLGMLDYADIVALNKFDRKGSVDALRDIKKQLQRNRGQFSQTSDDMPVYGTIASRLNDAGINQLFLTLQSLFAQRTFAVAKLQPIKLDLPVSNTATTIPENRNHYLGDIADCIRHFRQQTDTQSQLASDLQHYQVTRKALSGQQIGVLDQLIQQTKTKLQPQHQQMLDHWRQIQHCYQAKKFSVHDSRLHRLVELYHQSPSGLNIPKVALPDYHDHGDLLRWLLLENLPGYFPYTAGVFQFKRPDEEPTRMFAGEGDALRTNKRFKYLASHTQANRLSTAFDSVTLYGFDPDERPDIFGKIGNAGVSIATLDDMCELYQGFDLCAANTSVSMTINGPAAAILAMYFNTAIAQQRQKFSNEQRRVANNEEDKRIRDHTLQTLRGTVQADILKEDQGQNTCLYATDFGLRLMGDVQQYFIDKKIKHFYSVSVSGYHIAEAGANPITQLAFTLANGFTYIEYFLARGMAIDDFADRLSFFFSNGMDPEYSVIGRVARRIWAITLRDRYGARVPAQKLKYHIQTSGRSLHAQTIDINEIRTTLQALIAIYDNCNSLHTNARDEALTTPTEASVKNALAIQMIINKEWGLAKNENPNQGAFIIHQLTDLVEEAVLLEFDRLNARGGVLAAMESGYQRSKIQDESLCYENAKLDGSLPIVGINQHTAATVLPNNPMVARSTEEEKHRQVMRLRQFKQKHNNQAKKALQRLKSSVTNNENIFAELMHTVRYCTLGQITETLFAVGGKYRRNM